MNNTNTTTRKKSAFLSIDPITYEEGRAIMAAKSVTEVQILIAMIDYRNAWAQRELSFAGKGGNTGDAGKARTKVDVEKAFDKLVKVCDGDRKLQRAALNYAIASAEFNLPDLGVASVYKQFTIEDLDIQLSVLVEAAKVHAGGVEKAKTTDAEKVKATERTALLYSEVKPTWLAELTEAEFRCVDFMQDGPCRDTLLAAFKYAHAFSETVAAKDDAQREAAKLRNTELRQMCKPYPDLMPLAFAYADAFDNLKGVDKRFEEVAAKVVSQHLQVLVKKTKEAHEGELPMSNLALRRAEQDMTAKLSGKDGAAAGVLIKAYHYAAKLAKYTAALVPGGNASADQLECLKEDAKSALQELQKLQLGEARNPLMSAVMNYANAIFEKRPAPRQQDAVENVYNVVLLHSSYLSGIVKEAAAKAAAAKPDTAAPKSGMHKLLEAALDYAAEYTKPITDAKSGDAMTQAQTTLKAVVADVIKPYSQQEMLKAVFEYAHRSWEFNRDRANYSKWRDVIKSWAKLEKLAADITNGTLAQEQWGPHGTSAKAERTYKALTDDLAKLEAAIAHKRDAHHQRTQLKADLWRLAHLASAGERHV